MKRYLLFAGSDYYPAGGWADFVGDFDTLEAATDAVTKGCYRDWHHVVDTTTGEVM